MNQILLVVMVAVITSIGTVTLMNVDFADAITQETKTFTFGGDLLSKIDSYTYNNGQPISMSPDLPSITVFNWNDIPLSGRNQIEQFASAKAWVITSSSTSLSP